MVPAPQPAELCLWQLPVKKTKKLTPKIWNQWERPLLCLTPLPAIQPLCIWMYLDGCPSRENPQRTLAASPWHSSDASVMFSALQFLFSVTAVPGSGRHARLSLSPLISGRQGSGRGLLQRGEEAENRDCSILIFHSDTSLTFGKRSLALCRRSSSRGCQLFKASWWPPRA